MIRIGEDADLFARSKLSDISTTIDKGLCKKNQNNTWG